MIIKVSGIFFCSRLCKDEFERNPSNYVSSEGEKGRDRLLKSVEIVDNDPPKGRETGA